MSEHNEEASESSDMNQHQYFFAVSIRQHFFDQN